MSTEVNKLEPEKCCSIKDLEKYQTLIKFVDKSLPFDTDLLIYVMKSETEVAKVLPVVRSNLRLAEYFKTLEKTKSISTYTDVMKHPTLEIEISCLYIEGVEATSVCEAIRTIISNKFL